MKDIKHSLFLMGCIISSFALYISCGDSLPDEKEKDDDQNQALIYRPRFLWININKILQ